MNEANLRAAIHQGKSVFWLNTYFPVVKKNGNYRIVSQFNGKSMELFDKENILTCKPDHFFVAK